jgi:hypothetical protein
VLELSPQWVEFFRDKPETGMGYVVCSVQLKDGRTWDRVVIVGGVITSVNGNSVIPFSENEISKFVITHDKSAIVSHSK